MLAASILTSATLAAAAHAEDRPKVAVLDVQTTGIDPKLAPLLTEVLSVEIDALGRFEVLAGRDVATMLGFEKQKEVLGCAEMSCLAEIGGALGVQLLVAGDVGQIGETYVLNIKLINIAKAKTERRVYETVQGKIDVLLAAIKAGVHRLFPAATTAPPAAAAAAAEPPVPAPATNAAPQPSAPSPSPSGYPQPTATALTPASTPPATADAHAEVGRPIGVVPLLLWGVGVAALGTGVFFGARALQHRTNAYDRDFVGGQVEIERGETSRTWAAIALGVGLAAAASGLVVWRLGGAQPAALAVSPAVVDGAAGLVAVLSLEPARGTP
ncbi:MAG: hypothetical protein HY903_09275 [Deltaproteobacteria bacterium]|nr:hypothetical protein [Deltaproteobacteria bacterium]